MSHKSHKEDKNRKTSQDGDGKAETGPVAADPVLEQPVAEASKADEAGAARAETDQKLLRLQADFDNFRKRVIRERAELAARANEDLMSEILPVLDHMDIALASAREYDVPAAFVDGFKSLADQLLTVLNNFGLELLDARGKVFDPNEHEAIAHLPSETVPENGVIEQTRRGYRLAGKLLRAAQVVVSSGSGSAKEQAAPEGTGGQGKAVS